LHLFTLPFFNRQILISSAFTLVKHRIRQKVSEIVFFLGQSEKTDTVNDLS